MTGPPPLFTALPLETVWKIRIGLDLGCSEWSKLGGDVPSHPLEPLNIGNEEPSSYFPDSFLMGILGNRVSGSHHFSEVRSKVGLLLDHRLCWLSRGYRVCVPMHDFPATVFGSIDHRNPQRERGDILPPANLGLLPL